MLQRALVDLDGQLGQLECLVDLRQIEVRRRVGCVTRERLAKRRVGRRVVALGEERHALLVVGGREVRIHLDRAVQESERLGGVHGLGVGVEATEVKEDVAVGRSELLRGQEVLDPLLRLLAVVQLDDPHQRQRAVIRRVDRRGTPVLGVGHLMTAVALAQDAFVDELDALATVSVAGTKRRGRSGEQRDRDEETTSGETHGGDTTAF